MRSKPFVSANLDSYFLPGGGDLIIFFRKCQNPHLMPKPPPPPIGLDIDRCLYRYETTSVLNTKGLVLLFAQNVKNKVESRSRMAKGTLLRNVDSLFSNW